jgi:hypothetical protein
LEQERAIRIITLKKQIQQKLSEGGQIEKQNHGKRNLDLFTDNVVHGLEQQLSQQKKNQAKMPNLKN